MIGYQDPMWVAKMLELCALHEREDVPDGWPVGSLVRNVNNGRRGRVRWSDGPCCSIEFDDHVNVWVTTWDMVLRNYRKV